MSLTASFREVKYSCVDLGVDCCVDYFRGIVRFFCFLSYFFHNIMKGIEFIFHLSLDLLDTQPLSINHDELWTYFVEGHIVPSPVDEDILVLSLWDVFFVLEPSLAEGKHPGEVLVKASSERQGETFLAFRDRDGSIHRLLLHRIGFFALDDLPSCSSYFLVHLHVDLGSC